MIHLNIGSNLSSKFGSRSNNISKAIELLIDRKLKIRKISNFYETPSYPNKKMPKFLNVGILADYKNDFLELFHNTNLIEKKIGRIKSKKNDPRIIDIDVIDFNGLIIDTVIAKLPHPKSHQRNFVLYPILEIDPNWSHPIIKKNVEFLINKLSHKSRIEITRLKKNVNIKL